MTEWNKCANDITWSEFAGRKVWVGLDIGAISDFVSLVLAFGEDVGEPVKVEYQDQRMEPGIWAFNRRDYWIKHYCWLPESPPARNPRIESHIEAWTRQGHIRRTPGNAVDYDIIGADILGLLRPYHMQLMAIDTGFQGMPVAQHFMKIYGEERIVEIPQGIVHMADGFCELQTLIKHQRLHHDGDPVLAWMASNVAAESRGGLTKPSKKKSTEKIDGIVAATMAIKIAMSDTEEKSVYETRGMRSV
jgi:phage terminase large subunit-like protein